MKPLRDYYVYGLFRLNGVIFYVGKGRGDRWLQHEMPHRLARPNNAKNKIITEILEKNQSVPKRKFVEGLTQKQALSLERTLITAYSTVTEGGPLVNYGKLRGMRGPRTFSPKHRAALSKAMKRHIVNNPNWRPPKRKGPFSSEAIEKNRQWHLGRKLSLEHRIAISVGNHGRVVTKETRAKISHANKGKKRALFRPRPDTVHLMPRLVWITDGIASRRVLPSAIPKGWRRGRPSWR